MSKLKKVILLLAILLATGIIGLSIYHHFTEKEKMEENDNGVSQILIEDVVYLAVDSGDPDDDIDEVKMYTNAFKTHLVTTFNGCGDYHCKYNLQTEGISSGNYFVEVTTESSYTFSGFVNYNP